jgi:hypothetical protein
LDGAIKRDWQFKGGLLSLAALGIIAMAIVLMLGHRGGMNGCDNRLIARCTAWRCYSLPL